MTEHQLLNYKALKFLDKKLHHVVDRIQPNEFYGTTPRNQLNPNFPLE